MKVLKFLRSHKLFIVLPAFIAILALLFCGAVLYIFYADMRGYETLVFSGQVPSARHCAASGDDYYYISGGKVYDKDGNELISEGETYSIAVSGDSLYYVNNDRICRYNLKTGEKEALEAGLLYEGLAADNEAVFAKARGNIYQHWFYRADKETRIEEEAPFSEANRVTVSAEKDGYRFFANDDTLEYSAVTDKNNRIISRGTNERSLLYISNEKIITSDYEKNAFRIYGADGKYIKSTVLPEGYHYEISNIYSSDGKIYFLAQKQKGHKVKGYYNLPDRFHISDSVMSFDGENFETLYESEKNKRIVGFDGKNVLFAKGRKLFTSDGREIGTMKKSKTYIFEHFADRVFVRNEENEMINTFKW